MKDTRSKLDCGRDVCPRQRLDPHPKPQTRHSSSASNVSADSDSIAVNNGGMEPGQISGG
jgi:hypothetical protein